ncbi:glucose-1-phosphate adenylyltransferase subunit GlgD [Candidatus Soleaferrea massiliensis]|uniref:glucose-1-phosphate adenylyltransferase subunit GlgD n=1 Tax=Candidatus Soleaferrea massiliensis TaxID=1470354 RepID=UPI00058EB24B|nr:glucose-1-phosphate adenylyltransferase subunit GlgD [Candidatus Soleaferrea massiliensis]
MRKIETLGIIFSNMHDDMIPELTSPRTMGSIPFGGRYRLIDFALSNMVNSGISDIGVVTKSNYQSLIDHLGSGREWDLSRKQGGLSLLPPFGRASAGMYRGRLEALAGILNFIKHSQAEYVVMADCDIITNIDFRKVIAYHKEKNADITVAYSNYEIIKDSGMDSTVFEMNEDNRVIDIALNAQHPGNADVYMNYTVIRKKLLEDLIEQTASRDLYSFRKHILLACKDTLNIYAYEHEGYCRRINSIQDYYLANMDLLNVESRGRLFLKDRPIYTKVRDEVPATYGLDSFVSNSLIADGCVIEGHVENSILFRGVQVGKGAVVKNSIIMQAGVICGDANLDYIIADKDCMIKEGRMLMGFNTYPMFIAKGSVV